ncbi:MAG: transposase, partial [Myxococcales bacterium]|nr:transposase [Myxococcales bacterium]
PPRAPKKKGKVERAVRYVKSSFFKVREDCGGFSDIDHANNALARWNVETAGLRKHGTTGRRPLEHFEEERATLLRLPTVRFEPTVWHRCVVQKTAHVFFDEQFWSAPWRFLGATVMVQATSESVTLYVNDERVAQHSRRQPGPWHTHEAHLPEGRRELRHRSPSWWISEADALGDDVGALVRATFKADEVQQPFRRVAAMLKLLRSVPPERANRASERVLRFGNLRVDGLRTVLNNGLDSQPLAPRVGGDIVVCSMTYARPPSAFANAGVRS